MSIILEGVSKSFGERRVLQNVNLTLPDRGAVCFFGPSGCGKTTLTRLICGLERPDAGHIRRPEGLRFSCHFQEDRLLPWYTAEENLTLALGSREQAQMWLGQTGLADAGALYPGELSGGMRRRVSLARALGYPSDVLVLDEPLRELDAATCQRMLELIARSRGNRLLLLVTHDLSQAEALGCTLVREPFAGHPQA
ncbi:MAG TPA: ABC transporter ATP-binding protein [Candidatus Egerieenecus merdigallinarum]|nr:ABC transporter ATP-binding protein [Candidatus Egerieenecus merdigallinarum]